MLKKRILLPLLPLLIPFIVVFGCGLVITILQSLGLFMANYSYDTLFFAYKELFSDSWFLQSVLFSLYVAFAASILSIIIGTALSYSIWKLPEKIHGYTVLYKIPLILPHIAVGFIAVILLSKTGIISSIAFHLNLIDSFEGFPDLLYSRLGFDLISAYIYKETPFAMVMVYAILRKFDKRQIETAKMLGASQRRIFFSIILPFIMPIINATFIILFVFTFGGFDLPYVVGNSVPGMLSIKVYEYFFDKPLELRPIAMAMLTLIFLFSISFILFYLRISSRLEKGVRKL